MKKVLSRILKKGFESMLLLDLECSSIILYSVEENEQSVDPLKKKSLNTIKKIPFFPQVEICRYGCPDHCQRPVAGNPIGDYGNNEIDR